MTSGSHSPTLGSAIAMGYVDVEHAELGTAVQMMFEVGRWKPRWSRCRFIPTRIETAFKQPNTSAGDCACYTP